MPSQGKRKSAGKGTAGKLPGPSKASRIIKLPSFITPRPSGLDAVASGRINRFKDELRAILTDPDGHWAFQQLRKEAPDLFKRLRVPKDVQRRADEWHRDRSGDLAKRGRPRSNALPSQLHGKVLLGLAGALKRRFALKSDRAVGRHVAKQLFSESNRYELNHRARAIAERISDARKAIKKRAGNAR